MDQTEIENAEELKTDHDVKEEEKLEFEDLSDSTVQQSDDLQYVRIKINSKGKTYDREVLKQLPYFEARLSGRWDNEVKKYNITGDIDVDVDTKVNIIDSSSGIESDENTIAESKVMTTVNIGDDMPFTLDVFDVLITIPQTMVIDVDFALTNLPALLHCESYFMLDIIDQNMIKRYLELSQYMYMYNTKNRKTNNFRMILRVHNSDVAIRSDFCIEYSNHSNAKDLKLRKLKEFSTTVAKLQASKKLHFLHGWISKYLSETEKEIGKHRKQWENEWKSMQRGTTLSRQCVADEQTIINAFTSMIKLEWTYTTCRVGNFKKPLLDQLWKIIVTKLGLRNEKLIQSVLVVGKNIISHDTQRCTISKAEASFVISVLRDTMIYCFRMRMLTSKERMILAHAYMAAVIAFGWTWKAVMRAWRTVIQKQMISQERYQVLQWIIRYTDMYFETLRSEQQTMNKLLVAIG